MTLREDYTSLGPVVFQLCKEDEENNNSNNNNKTLNSSQHKANFSKFNLKTFFNLFLNSNYDKVDGSGVELKNYERLSIKSGQLVETNAAGRVDDPRWRKHSGGANPCLLPRFHYQNKRHQAEFPKNAGIVLALVKKGFLQQSRSFE